MTACNTVLAMTVAAVLLAGCGGSGGQDSKPSAGTPPSLTDAQAPPARLVVDVTIKHGEVTPTNAQLRATVKQPIVIRVDSDSTDELHVHSTPEHNFDIGVGPGQSFQFTADVPGRVDVELHKLDKTIATIQVQ